MIVWGNESQPAQGIKYRVGFEYVIDCSDGSGGLVYSRTLNIYVWTQFAINTDTAHLKIDLTDEYGVPHAIDQDIDEIITTSNIEWSDKNQKLLARSDITYGPNVNTVQFTLDVTLRKLNGLNISGDKAVISSAGVTMDPTEPNIDSIEDNVSADDRLRPEPSNFNPGFFIYRYFPGLGGLNNPKVNSVLQYRLESIDGTISTNWINCEANTVYRISKDSRVYVRAYTVGTYSNSPMLEENRPLKYISVPEAPRSTSITYSTDKPTIDSDYIFSWTAGQNGASNPISEYEYKIFKNTVKVSEGIIDVDQDYSVTLTPSDLGGLNYGDTLHFTVKSIGSVNHFTDGAVAESDFLQIPSASELYIRVDDVWKKGKVYIRDGEGNWHEASSIHIRDSEGNWQKAL